MGPQEEQAVVRAAVVTRRRKDPQAPVLERTQRVAVVALHGEEIHKSRCGCELADRRWASMGAIGR